MKFTYLYLVLSLICIGLFSEAQAAPQAGSATAAITKIDGDGTAKVRRKSGIESVAGVKQELFMGDKITTDARSIVEIMLADGTLVRVGLNSEYRLESVQKKSGIFTWVFGLAKGSIRALVEKNPKKNMVKFRVNTPVGTMGVRGTELVLDHNEKIKRTTLYTIEGRVEFGALGCYLKRKCIEVKTGEMASVGTKADERQPVAKPTDIASLLLMGGAKGDERDAATAEERLARAALFTDMKNAGALVEAVAGSIDATSKGEIDKIVKAASEAMAEAQDKLIGRTKQQRENLQKAIKDGSYADRLKLAEKFDDARDGSKGKGKDREKENLSAASVAKKLALADAILKSRKMRLALGKRTAMDNGLIEAKLKAAEEKLNEARAKIGLSEVQLTTDTDVDPDATVAAEAEASPKEVAGAVEELNKEMADGIIGEPEVKSIYENYKKYDKCGWIEFWCGDEKINGNWYDVDNKKNEIKQTTTIERKAGVCYKKVEKCGREMIPCDLSKGKACNPTFKQYECKTVTETTACPNK